MSRRFWRLLLLVLFLLPAYGISAFAQSEADEVPDIAPPLLDPTLPPGANFDLSVWQLILPVDLSSSSPSSGTPTIVPNVKLVGANGFQNQYFFTNSSDGAMGMKNPGVNCVPNPSHCMTDLQEMNPDGTPASWKPVGINLLTESLYVLAPGGNVCIAQIRLSGSKKPLAQVFYDNNGIMTVGVQQNPAGGSEIPFPLGQVPLGSQFSLELNYSDNLLSISVNGGPPVPLVVNSSLAELPVLFETGADGQTTAASDIHISFLLVTHIPQEEEESDPDPGSSDPGPGVPVPPVLPPPPVFPAPPAGIGIPFPFPIPIPFPFPFPFPFPSFGGSPTDPGVPLPPPPPPVASPTDPGVPPPPPSSGSPTTPLPVAGIDSTQWYAIVNVGNGLCVTDLNSRTDKGAPAVQQGCVNGEAQAPQEWQLAKQTEQADSYEIDNRLVDMSLNVTGGVQATGNNVPIQLWSRISGDNAQWYFISVGTDNNGHGVYYVISKSSLLCLAVPDGSTAIVQLQQRTCDGTLSQQFVLFPVNPASALPVAPTDPATSGSGGDSGNSNSGSSGSGGSSSGSESSGGSSSGSSGAPSIDPNGWYNVINVNSGLCVEDLDFGIVKGSTVDQWACGDGQANQQWQFTATDSGYYQVSNRYVAMSLNVTGGVSAVNTQIPIQLWTYSGATNEQWKPVFLGDGQWKLIARNSGLCMEVPGSSTSNGLGLDQNTCEGSTAEAFTFNPVTPANVTPVAPTDPPSASAPPVAPTPDSGAWYNVVNVNSGKCADVYQWGITLGTNLDQWTCGSGQANQQWQLTPIDSGYYRINSRYVLMSFNVTGGTGAVGTKVPIQLWSYGGSSNEQFKPVYLRTDSDGNDIYEFIARNSGLCLDVPGASTANGTQLDQNTCSNNNNAQAFTLVDVDPAPGSPIVPQQPAPTNPAPSNPPPTNPAPPPTVAPQPNPDLWYLVEKTDGSGLCVALPDNSTDKGTPLEQLPCNGSDGSQQWQFQALAGNLFAVINNYVNLEWNVTGGTGATAAGVKIQGWGPFGGQSNEEWFAVYEGTDSNGNQRWEFSARNSLLCLDTPGVSKQSGLQFQQASCTGSSGQIFILKAVNPAARYPFSPTTPNSGTPSTGAPSGSPTSPPPAQGYLVPPVGWIEIINANSRLCLDAAGGVAGNGVQLIQYTCGHSQSNQEWRFVATDSGWYKVENQTNTNMVMDIGGQLTNNYALMDTYQWNGQANQQFRLIPGPSGSGVWSLQARNSGKCVDLHYSSTAINQQLEQYSCNASPAQQFFYIQEYPAGGGGPKEHPDCRPDGDPVACEINP